MTSALYDEHWIIAATETEAINAALATQAANSEIKLYADSEWRMSGLNHGLVIYGHDEIDTPAVMSDDGETLITPATLKTGWRALLKVRPEFTAYIEAAKTAGLIDTYQPDQYSPHFAA